MTKLKPCLFCGCKSIDIIRKNKSKFCRHKKRRKIRRYIQRETNN